MPRRLSPVPTMCGRLRRAMGMPRSPRNSERLITRGTANQSPADFIPEIERTEVREFDLITGRSILAIPLVPQNTEVSINRVNRHRRGGPWPWKSHTREQKERKRLKKERDEEAAKPHAKQVFLRYSTPIHIDEWQNAACAHEQRVNNVAIGVSKRPTFNQQKQLVLEYLHERMELSTYNKFLHFETSIQIESELHYVMSNVTERTSSRLMLSTIVSENAITDIKKPYLIESGSQVTLSHHHCRIRRNVFCFVKCPLEQKPQKSPVLHYENVYIRLFSRGSRKPLYLRCEIPNSETLGHNRERMLLTVSETLDKYCQFQIQSLLEFKRRYQVHDQVPTFTKVLIWHTISRRYLSVDERLYNESLIVGKEIKACCFTAKNCNKRLTAKNYWVIKTRKVDED